MVIVTMVTPDCDVFLSFTKYQSSPEFYVLVLNIYKHGIEI